MRTRLSAALLTGALLTALLPALRVGPAGPVKVQGQEIEAAVAHQRILALPFEASHVALRWAGAPDAHVTIAFGRDTDSFGERVEVAVDEDAEGEPGEVFSGVLWTGGARYARVTTDKVIGALKLTAMDAGHRPARGGPGGAVAEAAVSMPPIISRADWGADESYRFNSGGYEMFAPNFHPLQKVIVHHTAGRNNDPDPEATIRAIYYLHAYSRGYRDIDYTFLIDWQGRIYEGRHARDYAAGEPITGEDLAGNVIRAAHASNFNDGTVGIALLGTFTKRLPPAAQEASLEKLIAWKLERHGINPLGGGTYTNPTLGNSKHLNNISGHRNVSATACPGEAFYNWFPTLRQKVADRIAATTGSDVDHTAPDVLSLLPMFPEASGATTMPFGLLFEEPVEGLDAGDFEVGGTSSGWTVESVTGKASAYTVTVVAPPGDERPNEGTVKLTLLDSIVEDKASNVGPGSASTSTVNYVHDDDPPELLLYQDPHRTVSNTEAFDWTVTFNEPVLGFTPGDIELGGPDADEWYVNWLLGHRASFEFMTKQPTPKNGTFTVSLPAGAVTDLAGNPSPASPVVTLKVDRTDPTTGTPKVSLRAATTLSGSALRVAVGFSGTDSGPAGIGSYDVRRSFDGSSFQTIGTAVTGSSLPWSMTSGHTYRFETRAHDRAGNVGDWKRGPTLRPALTQQSTGAIKWSGPTKATSYPSYSGGSQRSLRAAGASATYTTSARSLSFVTTKGPSRGKARIYVDGVLQTTVDLNEPGTTYRFVAFARTWSAVGTHTIKVVSVGSPVARVDIDAFGVIRRSRERWPRADPASGPGFGGLRRRARDPPGSPGHAEELAEVLAGPDVARLVAVDRADGNPADRPALAEADRDHLDLEAESRFVAVEHRAHEPAPDQAVARLVVVDPAAHRRGQRDRPEPVREPPYRRHPPEAPAADDELRGQPADRAPGVQPEERGDLRRIVLAVAVEGDHGLRTLVEGRREPGSERRALALVRCVAQDLRTRGLRDRRGVVRGAVVNHEHRQVAARRSNDPSNPSALVVGRNQGHHSTAQSGTDRRHAPDATRRLTRTRKPQHRSRDATRHRDPRPSGHGSRRGSVPCARRSACRAPRRPDLRRRAARRCGRAPAGSHALRDPHRGVRRCRAFRAW